jgi:peptidoglycan biosynthesis protein MviN/MurJ (putative lipid II flippase)
MSLLLPLLRLILILFFGGVLLPSCSAAQIVISAVICYYLLCRFTVGLHLQCRPWGRVVFSGRPAMLTCCAAAVLLLVVCQWLLWLILGAASPVQQQCGHPS